MSNKRIQVWYHANCDDGFGAAWAAYRHLKDIDKLYNAEFIPVSYEDKKTPNVTPDDYVYIVDFSYKRDTIEHLRTLCRGVFVIDHHKTAKAELEGMHHCHFDMEQSGAVLTWKFFHGYEPVPLLLKYIQANDLWQHHTMHEAKAVTRYIRTKPYTFAVWDALYNEFILDYANVINKAVAVEAYFQNQLEMNLQFARMTQLNVNDKNGQPLHCPIVNCSRTFSSEICHLLIKKHETKIAMSYFINKDDMAIVSIRGDGTVDVSAIAKSFGGGGHNDAAGFQVSPAVIRSLIMYTNVPNMIINEAQTGE